MAAMIQAGKIRHYGLSNETSWGVCEFRRIANGARRARTGHDAEQLQPRFARRRTTISPKCCSARRCRCSRTVRSRAGSCRGSTRPTRSRRARATRCSTASASASASRSCTRRSTAYAALAKERGITLVQLALGYVRSRWYVGATIIGATTMQQLREDIDAAQFDARRRHAGRDPGDPGPLSESCGVSSLRIWRHASSPRMAPVPDVDPRAPATITDSSSSPVSRKRLHASLQLQPRPRGAARTRVAQGRRRDARLARQRHVGHGDEPSRPGVHGHRRRRPRPTCASCSRFRRTTKSCSCRAARSRRTRSSR